MWGERGVGRDPRARCSDVSLSVCSVRTGSAAPLTAVVKIILTQPGFSEAGAADPGPGSAVPLVPW